MNAVEKNEAGKGVKVVGEELQFWEGGQGNSNMHGKVSGKEVS